LEQIYLSNFNRTRREGTKHKFYIYHFGAADHGAELGAVLCGAEAVNVKFAM
jgi:hypothetical protein